MRGFPKMQQISAYHAELPQILKFIVYAEQDYSRKVQQESVECRVGCKTKSRRNGWKLSRKEKLVGLGCIYFIHIVQMYWIQGLAVQSNRSD